tara:strand:- start:1185 stop:1286 length:102 start_codon:yes stop_codon:yes gene_type:complete
MVGMRVDIFFIGYINRIIIYGDGAEMGAVDHAN